MFVLPITQTHSYKSDARDGTVKIVRMMTTSTTIDMYSSSLILILTLILALFAALGKLFGQRLTTFTLSVYHIHKIKFVHLFNRMRKSKFH